MVLGVLLFLTGPLGRLPVVVLSTILCLIELKLFDLAGLRELWRLQRNEFVIALATVITVAQIGVMQGSLWLPVLWPIALKPIFFMPMPTASPTRC